jgi:hypothetical protein
MGLRVPVWARQSSSHTASAETARSSRSQEAAIPDRYAIRS